MKILTTKKDRLKARTTSIILAVILAVIVAIGALCASMIPLKSVTKKISADGSEILAMAESGDGDTYFLLSKTAIVQKDTFTNKDLSVFYFSQVQEEIEKLGKADECLSGSFSQWSLYYVDNVADNERYALVDGAGNIFKLVLGKNGFTVSEDHYLAKRKNYIKSLDNDGTDVYYMALNDEGKQVVQLCDFNDLNGGVKKSKYLWTTDIDSGVSGGKKIVPVAANVGTMMFRLAGDYLYIVLDGGNFIKVHKSFIDCVVDGTEIDYFSTVKDYYESQEYVDLYNATETEYFRNVLRGMEENTYTEGQIATADKDTLIEYMSALGKSSVFISRTKTNAKNEAQSVAENAFTDKNSWLLAYDKAKNHIIIDETCFDDSRYSVVYTGERVVYGVAYSEKNKAFYFVDGAEGVLYTATEEEINSAESSSYLSDFLHRIDAIKCKKGSKFSDFGNGLGLNKFANTLYLKYANEQAVSIVDINDTSNYKFLYTFDATFDIYGMIGDKDNDVMVVLRQSSDVNSEGKIVVSLCSEVYNPEKHVHKTLSISLTCVCGISAVILLLFTIWFGIGSKNDKVLAKIKTIKKDITKNKKIYIALIPFVVMLIMSCYYEAVGAISMSFFNYTRENPAWNWNNFGNFIRIFNQVDFWLSIENMLFFLVFDLVLCIIPPLIFAFFLSIIRNKNLSGIVRALMFIPGIIPGIATMLIWREGIYGTDGLFNQMLALFGREPIAWLDNVDYSRWALIFMGFPFVGGYLIFYGGMMNIPKEYKEACNLEGMGVVKRFLTIDIPLIKPQIKYTFVLTFISSVQNYARTYILGSSGTVTPVENMYRIMTGVQADYGMASAYATIIFVILFVAVVFNFKTTKDQTMGDQL